MKSFYIESLIKHKKIQSGTPGASGLKFNYNPKTLSKISYKKKAMAYYSTTPAIRARKILRQFARKYPGIKDDLTTGMHWNHATMCTWDKQIVDYCNSILRYEEAQLDADRKIRLLQLRQFSNNCEYDCSENYDESNLSYLSEVARWQTPIPEEVNFPDSVSEVAMMEEDEKENKQFYAHFTVNPLSKNEE